MKQTLIFSGVSTKQASTGNTKYTIVSNDKKYGFWDTKKNGDKTKAFIQYQQIDTKIGNAVEAEVEEEEKNFVNKEGETINYTDRRILYFYGDKVGGSHAPRTTENPLERQPEGITEQLERIETKLDKLLERSGWLTPDESVEEISKDDF